MKFKYVGPHDAVDLVGVGTIQRGKTADVSGAVAKSLDSQADWQRVDKPEPKTPATPATKMEE